MSFKSLDLLLGPQCEMPVSLHLGEIPRTGTCRLRHKSKALSRTVICSCRPSAVLTGGKH